MKNKLIAILCIFACSIIVIWKVNVTAEESNTTIVSYLSASKVSVKATDQFSVTIRIPSGLNNSLAKFKYELSYDSEVFSYMSYSMGQKESEEEVILTNDIENGKIIAIYENLDNEVVLNNGNIITFMFEVKPIYRNETFTFSLSGSDYYDLDGEIINGTCTNASVELFIPSTDTHLRSLSISEGTLTPAFDPYVTEYTATVDSPAIKIDALAPEKGMIVSGSIGNKALDYGENVLRVISKAESGSTLVYRIIITRTDNRSKDNTLKSISGVNNFRNDVTVYDIALPTEEGSFTAEAIANDSKAKISYNPSSKRVLLDYGETKKITITVSAENGDKREYVLNVTRKDDRNTNNLLKSLTVSGATINFDPNVSSYRVMVDNKYSNTIITALPESATSTVTGTGVKILKEGSNTLPIVVKAENGSEKVYTIVIIRKDSEGKISDLSNNTNLNYLRFNTTNIKLQQGVYSYEISLPNSSETGEIFYETEDSKAIVSLEGNRDLNVGKNYYRIRVTAENGTTVVYELTVIRQEIQKFLKNNREAIIDARKTSSDSTVIVSVEHNDDERIVDTSIIETLKNNDKTLTFQVFDANKKLDYSVSLNSKNIENIKTLDYRLKNVTSNQNRIDTLSNAKKTFYLNFDGTKTIPGKIKIKVNVSNTFTQENTLTLYYYNSENDSLELIEDNLYVNGGYTEFTINNMGDFILIDKEVMKMSESDSTAILIVGGAILGIILLIFIVKIIKRKRSVVKIPDINTDSKNNVENENKENIEQK